MKRVDRKHNCEGPMAQLIKQQKKPVRNLEQKSFSLSLFEYSLVIYVMLLQTFTKTKKHCNPYNLNLLINIQHIIKSSISVHITYI